MSNKRPYMPFYVADYLVDTLDLTTEEHGAYMLLLMAMWNAGGRLPNDNAKLAQITRCTPQRWGHVRKKLLPFFTINGDVLRHKRIEKEIKRVATISEVRSEAGKKGGRPKKQEVTDQITTAFDGIYHQGTFDLDKSLNSKESTKAIAKAPRARLSDARPRLPQTPDIDSSLRSESLPPQKPAESNFEKNGKPATVRKALETVLSTPVAEAVIEHRRTIRHPLTPYAATLLAKSFSAALSVCNLSADQAANQMIAHGWRGFEPEWLLNKPYATGPPRQGFADDGGRQSAEDTAFLESFIDEQRKRS